MLRFRPISILFTVAAAFAHPMGNFSVNHYTKLVVGSDEVRGTYALDLAEIPTFELLQRWNVAAESPKSAVERKAEGQMREWARQLKLKADGVRVPVEVRNVRITMEPGAGNMQVLRVTADIEAKWQGGKLEFEDGNYAERAGWKEVVAVAAPGTKLLSSSAASEDRSNALTAYPANPDKAPPQQIAAVIEVPRTVLASAPAAVSEGVQKPSPVVANPPNVDETKPISGEVKKGDYLSKFLGEKEITLSMTLVALAVAFGFGALHALEPGHGKTMVAAYLVGSRGTPKHALLLGAVTTFTHTISVFALGFVTLFLSKYILPDQLYPLLGAMSGLTIIWIGGRLFARRLHALRHHDGHDHGHHHHHHHGHGHGHDHHHHDHDHDHNHDHHHGPGGHHHMPEGEISMGSLVALGVSGGLVPCPSGLVLLLSAIAIGRPGLGLVLLTAFSAGLAVVLAAIGLVVLYAKNLIPERARSEANPVFRYVPVASAAVIVVVGCAMTVASLGIT